jgi:hypothetical protein
LLVVFFSRERLPWVEDPDWRDDLKNWRDDLKNAQHLLGGLKDKDWRHLGELLAAGQAIFSELKNICVWNKSNAGMGMFYRLAKSAMRVCAGKAASDIANVFLSTPGPHLRHSLSHGLLHDGAPYGADAIYGCWLIFRLCLLSLFRYRGQVELPFE